MANLAVGWCECGDLHVILKMKDVYQIIYIYIYVYTCKYTHVSNPKYAIAPHMYVSPPAGAISAPLGENGTSAALAPW